MAIIKQPDPSTTEFMGVLFGVFSGSVVGYVVGTLCVWPFYMTGFGLLGLVSGGLLTILICYREGGK